ncbi:hypothetical protein RJT34_24929 [Clitoria ternatea]|uniref:Leucine-rich repeat-containing N-terminal plant-type domain-containing protein n=1 Tax=Clitoria ternatea TaxID=43366 RepID=A0AAN9FV41_CLITE
MDVSPSNTKFILLWLLCSIMMFNSVMCKVPCNEKDMNILLNFKNGVIDPSGMLSSWTWFTELDCCEWTGIMCDNITGRVTQLNLPCHANHPSVFVVGDTPDDKSHCLTGELSLSLLKLEFLSYLDFSNNNFKSVKYDSMGSQNCNGLSKGNSSKLQYLDLSYNYDILIDNLRWISCLSSLQYLNLGGILLHKEIDWLQSVSKLPSLLELHLQSCQLQNIYPSLQYANFTSLQVLDLAENDFISELPTWLFNLSCDISHIDLSQNHFRGKLPTTLLNIRSIKSLLLSANYNLQGPIPDWIGQLEQLQELDLSYNSFSGPIPTNLGNLSSLIELNFLSNHLNGKFPESLGQLSNLEILRLAENSLTGIVSEKNLLSLSNLKHFSLSSPSLVYDFDPEWVPPFQLQGTWLGFVSGKLPSWLFTQSSLKTLTIEHSSASFEPLDKFWNFSAQLDYFSLTNNTINGDMSNVLINSKFAWLNSNNLRGGLPQLSPNVSLLNLCNNSLSGPLSPLLCHKMKEKGNLVSLVLSMNNLSGELPNCWMDWKSLIHVDLGGNKLTGKIPHSMTSLSNLLSLHLNVNMFFGEVPTLLENFQNLLILNLGENNFSGAISKWKWQGIKVKALQMRSNQFSGNIPPQICQLSSLMVLDLANNKLSGPVPNCLHNMTALVSDTASVDKFGIRIPVSVNNFIFTLGLNIKGTELPYSNLVHAIDLSSNNISQTMPLEIFMLTRLQSLNLSHNRLVGSIPKDIGNLKQLESIDLSNNRLSGEIPQSMSTLSFLAVLNLSFNNFMGKIPLGTQLQSFTNLSYIGNPQLCGPPLTRNCRHDETTDNTKPMTEDGDDVDRFEVYSCFYMGLGIGFAVGLLGVLSVIYFNRACNHAYFRFLDRFYVTIIQKWNSVY